MLKAVLAAGLFLSAAQAVAEPQAPPPNSQQTQAAKSDHDRVICQTQEQIGSRLAAKKICMTASQWKEHELQIHQQLDQLHTQVQPTGGPG
jgi:hypothetical protein